MPPFLILHLHPPTSQADTKPYSSIMETRARDSEFISKIRRKPWNVFRWSTWIERIKVFRPLSFWKDGEIKFYEFQASLGLVSVIEVAIGKESFELAAHAAPRSTKKVQEFTS